MEKSSTTALAARWWDLPSAVFLFLAILFSAWRMQSANWTVGLEHVRNVAIWGYLLGLALGYSIFKRRGVILLSSGYMLIIFVWQWLGTIKFSEEQSDLQKQLLLLGGRLLVDFGEFFVRKPVTDPLFFVVLLCIPFWFTAFIAGYQLTRHNNIIAAIIPTGILLIIVHISDVVASDRSWLIALFLLMCVMLMGRRALIYNRLLWKERRVQVTQENGIDISTTMMISAALLLTTAWSIPALLPYNEYIKDSWHEMTRFSRNNEFMDDAFASAKKTGPPQPEKFRDILQLGSSISQSKDVVFVAYVPFRAKSLSRLYWRGRVYDQFVDDHWTTTKGSTTRHDPLEADLNIPDTQSRLELRFSFIVYEPQATIYSPAQPVWVSQPVNTTQIGVSKQGVGDIFSISAYPAMEAGDSYDVKALVLDPTVEQLRSATESYPIWVTDRYLQLPENFSPRIRNLANEITKDALTPYDKALAVTNYLRSNIKYRPSFQLPSDSIDPIEYFLFSAKAGFCNYYATAEVLMLRSVGIPARMAVGYAQGEPDALDTYYTVRELHAHAWPEVYFTSLGWVEFEPTANQIPLERPEKRDTTFIPFARPTPRIEGDDQNLPKENNPPELQNQDVNQTPFSQSVSLTLTLSVLLIGILYLSLRRRSAKNRASLPAMLKTALERNGWRSPAWLNNWVTWNDLSSIERSFQTINYGLRRLGQPQPVDATPSDRARRLSKLLPAAQNAIESLSFEHQTSLFTRQSGNERRARRSALRIIYETLRARIRIFIMGYN